MDMNEEVVGMSKIGYGYNIRKSTVVVLGVIGRKQPKCGVRLGELLRPISSVYRNDALESSLPFSIRT
jgi:hypothetical protein